ncbi:ketosteroid isomerase-like protein [Janthinobacterium sp. CG_23.3]|uniref:nuclear transport factor 2 family protein n=1 Tax=Janthinobacterium sp. CG_23.3 TaxID=3349634 RepID=UPI0038D3B91D
MMTVNDQILDVEEWLRLAMLASDIVALDALLAPGLLFTNHLGQLFGKGEDLAAHESGLLKLHELTPSEQHVQLHGGVAVVSVRMKVSGTYAGQPANGDFRFTRMWARSADGVLQVVAAHAGMVV